MGYSSEYEALFSSSAIRPERKIELLSAARRIASSRPRYDAVSKATGVPWYVLGILHVLQAEGDFNRTIYNASKVGNADWEKESIGEVRRRAIDSRKSIGDIAGEFERLNGFGYREIGKVSPYLWAWTTAHESGQFIDGQYVEAVVPQRPGAMALLKALMEVDPLSVDMPAAPKAPWTPAGVRRARSFPWHQVGIAAAVLALGALMVVTLHYYRTQVELAAYAAEVKAKDARIAALTRELDELSKPVPAPPVEPPAPTKPKRKAKPKKAQAPASSPVWPF